MPDKLSNALMPHSELLRQLDIARQLKDQLAPSMAAMRSIEINPALKDMLQNATQSRDMLRAALGPLEDIRRLNISSNLPDISYLQEAGETARKMLEQFRLPDMTESARLLKQFGKMNSGLARQAQIAAEALKPFVVQMDQPWLNINDSMRSIGGFAELQQIGLSLRSLPAFDTGLSDRLRESLGDWRVAIDWPADIFTSLDARTEFYAARGLDTRLTDFPSAAFEQGASLAGLSDAPPRLLEVYDQPEKGDPEEEEGFDRTNKAHDRLQRFETHFRRFIEESMRAAYGDNWVKQKIPEPIRKSWEEKKQKARDNGEADAPLVAFADFTDYMPIIVRKDNWENVFKSVFRRAEFVTESFQRLYPIRVCTMHSRIITQDDELFLYVETKRLLTAIKEK